MKTFEDSLNTAVFTTSFVVRDKKEITFVTHDIEDGAWEFFSNDIFDDYQDVAMLISLEEMIDIDDTILNIADLALGYKATRQTRKDDWTITKKTE